MKLFLHIIYISYASAIGDYRLFRGSGSAGGKSGKPYGTGGGLSISSDDYGSAITSTKSSSKSAKRSSKSSKAGEGDNLFDMMPKSGAQKVILDLDYGVFADDIFALGLLLNSDDLVDLQYVIASGEYPDKGAQCVAKHLTMANWGHINVGIGPEYPDKAKRGFVCGEMNLGFALDDRCKEGPSEDVDEDGIAAVADLLNGSDNDDWWYIVLGGQTTLKTLIRDYPEAASKISTLVAMGGNWCAGFDPFPGVSAPTDETNISCDPSSANAVLDRDFVQFEQIYYVPLVVADIIQGEDYMKIVEAAETGEHAGAGAVIDFYKAWSSAGRADSSLVIHAEANTYDPATQSIPQFDACAVMLVLELLDDESCEDRLSLFDFDDGVHFVELGDVTDADVAFSLTPESIPGTIDLPDQCPYLTPWSFDPEETPGNDSPVKVALGFASQDAKSSFFSEMAERLAGTFGGKSNNSPACFLKKNTKETAKFAG
jgi:inosine-uridine nucleoside N-ribohydrolase